MNPSLRTALSDDTVFNAINSKFIKLQNDEVKRNNARLKMIIGRFIEAMGEVDEFFKKFYQEIIFTGSFYKGTRISEPTEYDLNVVIKLPISYALVQIDVLANRADLIRIRVPKKEIQHIPNGRTNFWDVEYLYAYFNKQRFLYYLERVVQRALNTLPHYKNVYILEFPEYDEKYEMTMKKSGPAYTLTILIPGENSISVDLVPVLQFEQPKLNCSRSSRLRLYKAQKWFAVPKPFYKNNTGFDHQHAWRYSFYFQEKEILSNHGRVKPVIRQMKKLRDNQNWRSIVSYHIEMLFFNELENLSDIQKIPFTLLFFKMLLKLQDACKFHNLSYYWQPDCNLFDTISSLCLYNIRTRLDNIIRDIQRNIHTDRFVIARYILTVDELNALKISLTNEPKAQPQEEQSLFRNLAKFLLRHFNIL